MTLKEELPPKRPTVLEASPEGHSAIERADQFVRNGDLESGIQLLRETLSSDPENDGILQELGLILQRFGKDNAGVSHLEDALYYNPDLVPSLVELGRVYSNLGQITLAYPFIKRALVTEQDNPDAHHMIGVLKQQQGELPEAIVHFRKALRYRIVHPLDSTQVAPSFKPYQPDGVNVTTALWRALHALTKANVQAFAINYLLCLIRRNSDFDPAIKEFDVGLPHEQMESAARVLASGDWARSPKHFTDSPRVFVHREHDISLNLIGHFVDNDTGVTFSGFWRGDLPRAWCRFERVPQTGLTKDTSPLGEPIWSLKYPDARLEAVYGDRLPFASDFDTVISSQCLNGFSIMTQCYAFSRIYDHWNNGQIKNAYEVLVDTQLHLTDDELLQDLEASLVDLIVESGIQI